MYTYSGQYFDVNANVTRYLQTLLCNIFPIFPISMELENRKFYIAVFITIVVFFCAGQRHLAELTKLLTISIFFLTATGI